MNTLILTTYDWVPDMPRGFVRDIRVRWALEEAGLPYRVESTPFRDRQPAHFAHQPFGQVPWLTNGDLVIFESGEPPRLYRRVVCSITTRPYRVCSGLHRTPPLLLRAGCIR
jgi:Glutathione S-transferase, N-terminal domain